MVDEPEIEYAAQGRKFELAGRRRGGWPMTVIRGLGVLLLVGILGAAAGAGGLYIHYAKDLPRLDGFDALSESSVTRFEAAGGALVGEWYRQRRVALDWDELPQLVILSFLAAEDARFFEHSGIDIRGLARAMWINLRSGSLREGASTITQQLAKTLVGSEKSAARKVREAILARRMEDLYSKTQILTWYLNVIYLGHGSYGVQAAAENYFRKDLWQLTLAEAAMLGGLPQAPSRVNPVVNLEAATERRAHVLTNMLRRDWIGQAEYDAAMAEPVTVYPIGDTLGDHAPYYTEAVRKAVATAYPDWLERDLIVEMAVEPGAQRVAARALGDGIATAAKRQGWRGPLASMERDAFFGRNAVWAATPTNPISGDDLRLARVSAVTKRAVTVEISPELAGILALKPTRWAAPWTAYPKDKKGRYRRDRRASFRGRLEDMRKAFTIGDVVLVALKGGSGRSLKLALAPVPAVEGALISAPVEGGGLDAAVGGWDFDRSQVNRSHSLRQTGSTMKPIIYSKAYDLGLPPSALFSGAPFREGKYNPTGEKTKDDMLLWEALTHSENAVSLRVLQYVLNHTTLDDYRAWARRLGLRRELNGYTSEILGSDQTPLSMLSAFMTFARGGLAPVALEGPDATLGPAMVRKITDADGNVLANHIHPLDPHGGLDDAVYGLWRALEEPPVEAIPQDTAYLLTSNLRQVVRRGTGKRARKLKSDAAGKTGTLPYDVWFAGFTSRRAAVSWIGMDTRIRALGVSEKTNKVYGSDTALPPWIAFMTAMDDGNGQPLDADRPEGVVDASIDPATGLLANGDGAAAAITIPHREGTEPTEATPLEDDPALIEQVEDDF